MIPTLLWLAASVGAPTDTDFLAQTRAGKVICANPDIATKTCSSIVSYKVATDGKITEISEVLLSPSMPVTLGMSVPAEIHNSTTCGAISKADLDHAIVRVNGELLPAERQVLVMEKISEKFAPFIGRRACETLQIEGGQLLKYGEIEGMDLQLPGKPVAWIDAAAGYRVAPKKGQ